jgi:oligosaccharide reducing-end xylanase
LRKVDYKIYGYFYSDSYRVAMKIGLDASWFNKDESLGDIVDKLQTFFSEIIIIGIYYEEV